MTDTNITKEQAGFDAFRHTDTYAMLVEYMSADPNVTPWTVENRIWTAYRAGWLKAQHMADSSAVQDPETCDHVWSDPSINAVPTKCIKCGTTKVIVAVGDSAAVEKQKPPECPYCFPKDGKHAASCPIHKCAFCGESQIKSNHVCSGTTTALDRQTPDLPPQGAGSDIKF